MKPAFIITIDTEGDNLWSKPKNITTQNANYIERFQILCEKHGFKPTYLTNYEMTIDPVFQDFGKTVIENRNGEIGAHIHAWNSPPIKKLTSDDFRYHPYLIDFDQDIIRAKIDYLTKLLEDVFQVKMKSHRAGRWAFNEIYARQLVEFGYKVDCSVTPYISWKNHLGDPEKNGGTNYTDFPSHPYFVNLDNIKKPGTSGLLEVPMSVIHRGPQFVKNKINNTSNKSFISRVYHKIFPVTMLRPGKYPIEDLLALVQRAVDKKYDHLEFMLHSSEFMPGGSPVFKSEKAIEELFSDINILFAQIAKHFTGMTLHEYYKQFSKARND